MYPSFAFGKRRGQILLRFHSARNRATSFPAYELALEKPDVPYRLFHPYQTGFCTSVRQMAMIDLVAQVTKFSINLDSQDVSLSNGLAVIASKGFFYFSSPSNGTQGFRDNYPELIAMGVR
jgi:hypothetical protein